MISIIDVAIVLAYLIVVFVIGIIYRRAGSTYEYMVAGGE